MQEMRWRKKTGISKRFGYLLYAFFFEKHPLQSVQVIILG